MDSLAGKGFNDTSASTIVFEVFEELFIGVIDNTAMYTTSDSGNGCIG
jgi:hypothetical protein